MRGVSRERCLQSLPWHEAAVAVNQCCEHLPVCCGGAELAAVRGGVGGRCPAAPLAPHIPLCAQTPGQVRCPQPPSFPFPYIQQVLSFLFCSAHTAGVFVLIKLSCKALKSPRAFDVCIVRRMSVRSHCKAPAIRRVPHSQTFIQAPKLQSFCCQPRCWSPGSCSRH